MPSRDLPSRRSRAPLPWIALTLLVVMAGVPPSPAGTPPGTEIVNIASSSYLSPSIGIGQVPPQSVRVDSNPVMTRVVGSGCFDTPELRVAPRGVVAPGTVLTYEALLSNALPVAIGTVEVRLPLDPGLAAPREFSSPFARLVGGGSLPCTGSYDPGSHTLTWSIPNLPVGAGVYLDLEVAVRTDLTPDTMIAQSGVASSPVCDASPSNTVMTMVVPPALEVTKRADRSSAVPGDGVVYALTVTHNGSAPDLTDVVLTDVLPPGLAFAAGSVRLDGVPLAPGPPGGEGKRLSIPLGDLAAGESRTLTLAAVVLPGAREGLLVNRATARGVTPAGATLQSNTATASFTLDPGPFRRETLLIGRVFLDADGDGRAGPAEPGIPGALVLLENGRGALTDVTGRWSVEGVRPGTHVARVDPRTLPPGLSPRAAGALWGGTPWTRFVEVRAATLAVVDFPMGSDDGAICTIGAAGQRLDLPAASLVVPGDSGATAEGAGPLLSAAVAWLDGAGRAPDDPPVVNCPGLPRATETLADLLVRHGPQGRDREAPGGAGDPAATFESVLRSASPEATILTPADGSRADGHGIRVDVVYPLGTRPRLTVEGRPIDEAAIGTRSVLESRGIVAARYVGVSLAEGPNRIEFRAVPEDGEPVAAKSVGVTVHRPSTPIELRLSADRDRWVADGATPARLIVEALDGAGVRARSRELVTIAGDGLEPRGTDAAPADPGFQVRLNDGRAELDLAPLTQPGRRHVVATAAELTVETWIDVVPGAGEWRITGLAEGRVAGDAGLEGDGGQGPGLDDGITGSGGRVALFARGPLGETTRLTVSLDTDRRRDRDRLENDPEPDLVFPLTGDGSTPTDEATTQGKLFVRVDGERGYGQWGEFSSRLVGTELARYDRRLTGLSGGGEIGRARFEGFASSSDQRSARDVFAADGTSGPFLLRSAPVVARSETVIVEVRDRYRTDEVLARHVQRRDLDYNLDPVAGTILFRSALPAFDADLNPRRVVVTYEGRSGGSDRLTGGGRFTVRAAERLTLGTTGVVEQRDGGDLSIYGVDVDWRPLPGTTVQGEIATSRDTRTSTATRFAIRSRPGERLDWELSYRDMPLDFDNPGLLGSPELGSLRYGGAIRWQPGEHWRVRGEAYYQDDQRQDLRRRVAGVDAERRVGPVTFLTGARSVGAENAGVGSTTSTLLSAGARGRLGSRWTAELLREEALADVDVPGYPTRTTAGVAYALGEGSRLFLRHEQESSSGPTRDRTVAGVEGRINERTRAEASYRLEGAGSETRLRSLTGIETVLPVGPQASMRLSVARLETVGHDDAVDHTSLAAGYERQAGDHLLSGRYELRLGARDDRHLMTASGTFRVGSEWSLFVRERLFVTRPDTGPDAWRAEGLLGAAYRHRGSGWQFLGRLDHSVASGTATTAGGVAPDSASSEPAGAETGPSPSPVPAGIGFGAGRGLLERGWYSVSLASGRGIGRRQRVALTTTLRRVEADEAVGLPATSTHLLSLHYTAQIHPRWTLGGSLRRFEQRETRTARHGQGLELGFLALRNLWITAGYNFAGFEDRRFPGNDVTDSGPFLSLRFKFDEHSLRLDRTASE